jgi:hypothetical protein
MESREKSLMNNKVFDTDFQTKINEYGYGFKEIEEYEDSFHNNL